MAKTTKANKPAKEEKAPKPTIIKEPTGGLPTSEQDWTLFAKKNKVKLPFFCVDGRDFTRRTSDGKAYLSAEQFSEDGGTIAKIHKFEIK